MLTVERYRKTRFWAVYECGELLCVTVYRKGANAVKERLEEARRMTASGEQRQFVSQPN
jgi:hypothetical protein